MNRAIQRYKTFIQVITNATLYFYYYVPILRNIWEDIFAKIERCG